MLDRKTLARGTGAAGLRSVVLVAVLAGAARLACDPARAADPPTGETESRLRESPVRAELIPAGPTAGGAVAGGGCAQQEIQYTSIDFDSKAPQAVIAQAGFVEDEVAAVQFQIPADDFPLVVRGSDMVFAQNHSNPTVTQWTWRVWDGTPETGDLVASFSSDGKILPHISLPFQGSNAVAVRVLVDPDDPEQVIVTNKNGANAVTIGYRVDVHNDQDGDGCFGIPASSNAFPSTDNDGVAQPALNWLNAIDCGPFGCPAGWSRFAELGPCTPSGDWNMRIFFEPLNCAPGACCLPDTSCFLASGLDCLDQGGTFQGSNTICEQVECPEAKGACCQLDAGCGNSCFTGVTEGACTAVNGVWLGPNSGCAPGCDTEGACCFEDDTCLDLDIVFCCTFDGTFAGHSTSCDAPGFDCNAAGACCFDDGSCTDGLSPDDCDTFAGVYQGDDTTCAAANCPPPLGACCAESGGCGELDEETCNQIPNTTWAGPQTTCDDVPDPCEANPCPADTNGDQVVDVDDLVNVILAWDDTANPDADVNDDGIVDVDDLVDVVLAWGDC